MTPPQLLTELPGDLFKTPSTTPLAHCISSDLKMGAGIAKTFSSLYGRPSPPSPPPIGSIITQRTPTRTVFHLITKSKYFHKPTLRDLEACVRELARECNTRGISEVAMPRIGCGLDRLRWEDVRPMVERAFGEVGGGCRVMVYVL